MGRMHTHRLKGQMKKSKKRRIVSFFHPQYWNSPVCFEATPPTGVWGEVVPVAICSEASGEEESAGPDAVETVMICYCYYY